MNPLPCDTFARRLRQERERLRISQAELANRIAAILGQNVDATAITRIEQQTRAVRLDEAVAVAEALDVPLQVLISEEPARDTERQIQQHLAELALAQKAWEESRVTIERINATLARLTIDQGKVRAHAEATDPHAELGRVSYIRSQVRMAERVTPAW